MFFNHSAERFDDAGFRHEKQQRKRAVAVLVILSHQVVDGFVKQPRTGEGATSAAALFRRAIAQCVVHERCGLIGIDFVKIANRFLAHGWCWIVEQISDLSEWRALWFVATLGPILGGLTESGDVAGPLLVVDSSCRGFFDLLHFNAKSFTRFTRFEQDLQCKSCSYLEILSAADSMLHAP